MKSALYFTGIEIVNKFFPFLISIYLTHQLLPEEFALLEKYTLIFGVTLLFVTYNQNSLLAINISKKIDDRGVGGTLAILFFNTLLSACLIVLLNIRVFDFEYIAIPAIAFFHSVFLLFSTRCQYTNNIKGYAVSQLSIVLFTSILTVYLVDSYGAEGRILSIGIGTILVGTLCLFFMCKTYSLKTTGILNDYKFGTRLLPYNLINGWFRDSLPKIFILSYMADYLLGGYGVAFLFSTIFNIILNSLSLYFNPIIFRMLSNNNNVSSLINKIIVFFVVIYFFFALIAPALFSFLVGEKYQSFSELIPIISLGLLFSAINSILSNILIFKEQEKKVSLSAILSVFFVAALSFLIVRDSNSLVILSWIYVTGSIISFLYLYFLYCRNITK